MTSRSQLRAWSVVAIGLAATACGELAHTNPFDPASKVDIQLTGPDSAFSLQQVISFSFTSTPVWPGVEEWKTTNEGLLHSLGDGRYGVVGAAAPPNDTASVLLMLGAHSQTHRVVVRQRLVSINFNRIAASAGCSFAIGTRNTSVFVEARDANGFRTVISYPAQVESTRPSVLRIDANPGGPAQIFSIPVTPLSPGTSYFIATTGGLRDSVLVTVR